MLRAARDGKKRMRSTYCAQETIYYWCHSAPRLSTTLYTHSHMGGFTVYWPNYHQVANVVYPFGWLWIAAIIAIQAGSGLTKHTHALTHHMGDARGLDCDARAVCVRMDAAIYILCTYEYNHVCVNALRTYTNGTAMAVAKRRVNQLVWWCVLAMRCCRHSITYMYRVKNHHKHKHTAQQKYSFGKEESHLYSIYICVWFAVCVCVLTFTLWILKVNIYAYLQTSKPHDDNATKLIYIVVSSIIYNRYIQNTP